MQMKKAKFSYITFIFLCLITYTYPTFANDKETSKCKLVDLFIGTAGDNGQVDPAACIPYGMVRVCPDMEPRSHVGYDYTINKISGFTVNRISGIGCGGAGGNLRLKPVRKTIYPEIVKETEAASPGYYTTTLDNNVKVELSAANNMAIERFDYSKQQEAILTFDVTAGFEAIRNYTINVISNHEIEGYITSGNTCNHGEYTLYYNLTTDQPFTILTNENGIAELNFELANSKTIEARISVSPIGTHTARQEKNMLKDKSFSQLKEDAKNKWEDILSRITIEGANKEDETLFYTGLYRVFLSPANVTSQNGYYLTSDGTINRATDFTYYSSWSMWDSYRTKFPLIALLDEPTMSDIATSLCKLYKYGKRDWATKYESTPTVRTEHSIAIILDAYRKGIKVNLEDAYEGFLTDMATLQTTRPDQAFETCIDYWSMAQIASILRKTTDATKYNELAEQLFRTTWDKSFKDIDPSFTQMRNSGLYQGTRWQYRWGVPQYLSVMEETSGGKDVLATQLDYYYANNLSNQTNEPGLHIPYLYNRFGHYEEAQKIVRKILTEEMTHLYGGNAEYSKPVISKTFTTKKNGFLPEMDEDDGTMSAYYVFGTIGLYPLIVGEPWYEITSPLYDKTTIKLVGNKHLVIETKNRKSINDSIRKVTFNGLVITDFRINHNDLVKGGAMLIEY